MELRVQGATGQRGPDRPATRYLYVNQHTDVCRGVVFSLDLNSLKNEQELQGKVTDLYHLASAAESALPDQTQEKAILLEILRMVQKHDEEGCVSDEELAELGQLYFYLVDQGGTFIFKQKTLKVEGQFSVWVSGTFFSGPVEHLWQDETDRPRLFIAVTPDNDPMRTVFEQSQEGLQESHIQLADTMERMAAYANDEDVTRDDSGKVVGLSGNEYRERAVIEAERAAGVRKLELAQLEFINNALQQALQA